MAPNIVEEVVPIDGFEWIITGKVANRKNVWKGTVEYFQARQVLPQDFCGPFLQISVRKTEYLDDVLAVIIYPEMRVQM